MRSYDVEALQLRSDLGDERGRGLKCFTLWSDLKVDLLLVDIILPGMNGLEPASRIKELPPQLRVIFMSGYLERDSPVPARGTMQFPGGLGNA